MRSGVLLLLAIVGCSDPAEAPPVGGDSAQGGGAGALAEGGGGSGSGAATSVGGEAPAYDVVIASPIAVESFPDGIIAEGTVFNVVLAGGTVTANGSAAGGVEPYVFSWVSDLDGAIGSSDDAVLSPLTEGDHQVRLVATDANGVSASSAPLALHVLPPTFDWSHKRRPSAPPDAGDWMTPVDSQQQCGSCWAMAAVAAVEGQLNIQAGDPTLDINLSQQDVIDCDAMFVGCGGGASEQALSGYMHDVGVPLESCIPFVGHDDTCRSTCIDGSPPSRYVVESTSWVSAEPGGSHDGVRAWMQYQLVHHGPIPRSIVNMLGYDPVTHLCEAGGGDHYAVVVGYDHAAGLWILKNSWGASWNGDGYFEVAYDNCAVDASATIVDAVVAP